MTVKLLRLACVLEILTALALVIAPSVVAWLILGEGASGTGIALGRIAGFVLLSLGLACYPRSLSPGNLDQAVLGMLTYNTLITVYLIYLGISGGATGGALWLVAAIHAVLAILFAQAGFKGGFSSTLQP
jgi:hypothetical protein